jgi:hypothetical protein
VRFVETATRSNELVELAANRQDLNELRRLATLGDSDATAELVQLAEEIGDIDELRRLATLGNTDATDVLAQLDEPLTE